MSSPHVVVSVERSSVIDVRTAIETHLGTTVLGGAVMGLQIEISENREAVEYATRFSREQGIPDDNPIWSEIDPSAFALDVEVRATSGSVGASYVEMIGDTIAKLLSRDLHVRTALSIDNGYVPFGIYEEGVKIRDYPEQYSACFRGRAWIPASIADLVRGDQV